jgi:hypothetical protein
MLYCEELVLRAITPISLGQESNDYEDDPLTVTGHTAYRLQLERQKYSFELCPDPAFYEYVEFYCKRNTIFLTHNGSAGGNHNPRDHEYKRRTQPVIIREAQNFRLLLLLLRLSSDLVNEDSYMSESNGAYEDGCWLVPTLVEFCRSDDVELTRLAFGELQQYGDYKKRFCTPLNELCRWLTLAKRTNILQLMYSWGWKHDEYSMAIACKTDDKSFIEQCLKHAYPITLSANDFGDSYLGYELLSSCCKHSLGGFVSILVHIRPTCSAILAKMREKIIAKPKTQDPQNKLKALGAYEMLLFSARLQFSTRLQTTKP